MAESVSFINGWVGGIRCIIDILSSGVICWSGFGWFTWLSMLMEMNYIAGQFIQYLMGMHIVNMEKKFYRWMIFLEQNI